jgi:hypothetical protein
LSFVLSLEDPPDQYDPPTSISVHQMVGVAGFEPAPPSSRTRWGATSGTLGVPIGCAMRLDGGHGGVSCLIDPFLEAPAKPPQGLPA